MAPSTCSITVSLPALLLAQSPPLAITCRARHGAARAHRRVVARPARRTLGSVRYGTGAAALRVEEAEVQAVPPSVPVRVAYELQLAGHRYLDVRTEGEFDGAGHPAGAVNVPYMYSTGSGMTKNTHFVEKVSAISSGGMPRSSSDARAAGGLSWQQLNSAPRVSPPSPTLPEGSLLGGRTGCPLASDGGGFSSCF